MYRVPMLSLIDRRLNALTMYRMVLYGLLALAAVAIVLGVTGVLSYGAWSLIASLAIALGMSYASNHVFSALWKVPVNSESAAITGLILFFLFSPIVQPVDVGALALACVLAMASKFVLAFRGKHLFNPAAFAAASLGLTPLGGPIWWIGSASLLPAALIVGLLVVRKIRRAGMFVACVLASTVTIMAFDALQGTLSVDTLVQHLLSWPIVFFASIMVTEPLTTPPRRNERLAYGAFVGALSSWPIVLGPVFLTPELALLVGNLYSYAVGMRRRLLLRLREQRLIARDTYEYVFDVAPPLRFLPGQYLEWTLPHVRPDTRGNRRYFTIASSPTEDGVRLGVKIGKERSSFKETLLAMKPGDTLYAGQTAGDFVLPRDPTRKLVFMAGGIGITPFRSMIAYLLDRQEQRDIVLFYGSRTVEDVAYGDLLAQAAQRIGLRTVSVLMQPPEGDTTTPTTVDATLIAAEVPDYRERTFYLSGPTGMVDAYKKILVDMGVRRAHIKTDYFPGFA